MEDLRTFYDVLEVPETASAAEASTAYKRMVKEYHPDRLVGLPEHLTKLRKDAEEKWQEIQDAWDVLGDPAKRAQYDEALKQLRAEAAPASAQPPSSAAGPSSPPPSSQYTPPPPPPPSWSAPPPPSPPPGSSTGSTSSSGSAPPSKPGMSRGWAIALGWVVFFVVLFFGEAVGVQSLERQRPQPPGWLAATTFYSLFGAAIFVGVMITGLLQAKRRRAVVSGVLGAATGLVFFILLGVSAAVPGLQRAVLGDPQNAIPEALNRIYAALDDGRVGEAAPLLSPDLLRNAQYLCKPFTHRAHYASSIVPLNDGTFLARERVLFKPFTEKAYLLWFRPATGGYVLFAAKDDPFTSEITAAREAVRQFIFAGRAGQWDAVARYASPHLPVDTLKEDAWQTYFAGMTKAEIDYVEAKSDRGLKVQLSVAVRGAGVWAPDFLIDLSTGKIVGAYYVVPNGMFTATSGAPTREGITDPDIEHDTLARFGLLNNALQAQASVTNPPAGASTSLEAARRLIPAVLDRIYSALNDGQPQEASSVLPPDLIKNEHDLDYLCQPFTHRAHYVASVVEQPDGTYLARVRTLFKPFKERAFVFHFRRAGDSYVAFRIEDDSFAQEGDAARDAVRQFILASKAGDWDRVAQYASPHLPIDELKTPAWERYLSRIGGTDPEGSMRINSEHGIMIEQQFVLRLLEDPGFLIDPTTGKIVRAFYKVGTNFTNAASPPDYAGITDPDINKYVLARFKLLPADR